MFAWDAPAESAAVARQLSSLIEIVTEFDESQVFKLQIHIILDFRLCLLGLKQIPANRNLFCV